MTAETEPVEERRADVHLDTLDWKERWTSTADEDLESLPKFVQSCSLPRARG